MPNSTARLAADAATAIGEINHTTFSPDALRYPPQVSEVTQPLATLVGRLPQTVDQLASAVRRHLSAGLIRMDDGTDSGEAAEEALRHLGEAQDCVRAFSDSLDKAASILFHMGTVEAKA